MLTDGIVVRGIDKFYGFFNLQVGVCICGCADRKQWGRDVTVITFWTQTDTIRYFLCLRLLFVVDLATTVTPSTTRPSVSSTSDDGTDTTEVISTTQTPDGSGQ